MKIMIDGPALVFMMIGVIIMGLYAALALTFTKLIPAIRAKNPAKVKYAWIIAGLAFIVFLSFTVIW